MQSGAVAMTAPNRLSGKLVPEILPALFRAATRAVVCAVERALQGRVLPHEPAPAVGALVSVRRCQKLAHQLLEQVRRITLPPPEENDPSD